MRTNRKTADIEKNKKMGVVKRIQIISFVLLFAIVITSCEKNLQDARTTSLQENTTLTSVSGNVGVNVVLNTAITNNIIDGLSAYGKVGRVFPQIKALTMLIPVKNFAAVKKLSYVSAINEDSKRDEAPTNQISVSDFSAGINTWNLDAVNVTQFGATRVVEQDGTGVYVGVLDTGLPNSWEEYFPKERIATQYGKAFGGGGGENGNVSEPTNKWRQDQDSHGLHVTSTIIGYQFYNQGYLNGVAPKATVIPVKVLNQNGSGWSSVVAEGIIYLADLKAGVLKSSPMVINMSLGGPTLDAMEKAAIDYAISKGVIIVASAGNSGDAGMGYPGAYQPVISVAAAGWKKEFTTDSWWFGLDVPDPTNPDDFYIADFSSRRKTGQDLDVTAPGANIVGPYQTNGQVSYYYLSGTSMASPHVTGIVALMAQKKPSLTATAAETKLTSAAISMDEGTDAAGSGFITANAALKGL